MEKNLIFKPLTAANSKKLFTKGNALPVNEDLIELSLEEAGVNGEAIVRKPLRKTKTNPRGSGALPKDRDRNFYKNHKFVTVDNNVTIVLEKESKLIINNYHDFIKAALKDTNNDIVDILPRLYNKHYELIKQDERIKVNSLVTVNFKYRSINLKTSILEKTPTKVIDIKFSNLSNMTAVIVYLENGLYYSIHELDLVKK